jgi:hypothetical protein
MKGSVPLVSEKGYVQYCTKRYLLAQNLCIQKCIFRWEGKEEGNGDNVVRYKR